MHDLESRSTLGIYKQFKHSIVEEKFYDNTFGSVLLFKARSNCLKLNWRNRFQGGDVSCRLCGAQLETLEHFILECPGLHEIRQEFEIFSVGIEAILGFENGIDIENMKLYLKKIWMKRKAML